MEIGKLRQITLYPLPLTPSRWGREDIYDPLPGWERVMSTRLFEVRVNSPS
jgi:hypothetical protein